MSKPVQPVRLHKENTANNSFYNSIMSSIEAWCLRHATLLFIVVFALLLALFVALIFVLTGVSATDSGVTYNQFNNII